VPEIRLHRALPSSGLHQLADADADGFGAPYWAYDWAGGLALARHLLDHPGIVAGRRVLDLGSGSGLVAIAAAKAGARNVLAAEVDPYAAAALALNAELNAVAVELICRDITGEPPPDVDLILVGDLFYAAELARRVTAFLDRALEAGIPSLVGDPWRAHLPTSRLTELARYEVRDMGLADPVPSGVFAFGGIPKADRSRKMDSGRSKTRTREGQDEDSGYRPLRRGGLARGWPDGGERAGQRHGGRGRPAPGLAAAQQHGRAPAPAERGRAAQGPSRALCAAAGLAQLRPQEDLLGRP
jgi:predicted nicotinamide N-methyase